MDVKGNPVLVYQKSDQRGKFNIYFRKRTDQGWSPPEIISENSGNNWNPALASENRGKIAIAWDGYNRGSYDIYLRFINKDSSLSSIKRVSDNNLFNNNVSISPATDGKFWISWNTGTKNMKLNTGPILRDLYWVSI